MSATLSAAVSVTTGNPIVVPGADSGGWVPAAAAALPARRGSVDVWFVLRNLNASHDATLIIEGAQEVSGGVAAHSEVLTQDQAVTCLRSGEKAYVLRGCPYPYVRLSAASDDGSAILVQGGIDAIA